MNNKKSLIIIFSFFILLAFAGYLSGLFIDVTRDAGKYATISKEIFENGNFINLTVHGEAYDQKPPLLFWLGAAGFYVGHISNFWFKFPVFILVLLGFYGAYKLGETLYNKQTGIVTAFLMFTSCIYFLYSMDIHTDTLLQVFITLSIWQLFEFVKTGKSKNFIFGFIAVGLAMLTKGPIGAAIPAFAVGGHILLKKEFRKLLDLRWLLGILISFVVVSPAILGLSNQFGWEGIRFFFWENMAGRYTGSYVANAVNDPFFYIHNLLYLLLPWSLMLFIAVFLEFKQLIQNKFKATEFVTFTGIWIYFLIISSSESQLPNYVFPVIPLISVIIAKWVVITSEEYSLRWKIAFTTQNIVVSLIWIAVFVLAIYLFPGVKLYYWLVVLVGAATTFYILKKSDVLWIKLLAPSAIAVISLFFLMNTHVFPYIFSFQAPPKAARYFTENSGENDKLYNYRYTQYELFFYSDPQALQLYSADDMKMAASQKGSWIFTDKEGLEEIQKLNLNPEVIEYQHLFLNKGAKFILPEKRQSALFPMYLVHFQ